MTRVTDEDAAPCATEARANVLRARRLGIHTQQESVVFMRTDCTVCRAEGFTAHTRVRLSHGRHSVIATLYHVGPDLLDTDAAGLSESAWHRLALHDGDEISVSHPRPLESLSRVRGKIYGQHLDGADFDAIIKDVTRGLYSDIQLSSFITACSAQPLDRGEMTALTRAMVDAGEKLAWDRHPIVDKHSVGGLPGNRTTPIVVAIVSACGLTMPKTSSRAITSPAGTADTMETLAPVALSVDAMRRVVEREGGCVVWGGAMRLSPADDTLIRVERALDLDSEGQLVASVLSKKIAAGATHLVLDVPVGPTAKVRSAENAGTLTRHLVEVAAVFGVRARTVVSDGTQPVGRGIGPALEARDVLGVLRGDADAPSDLRGRALDLAGALLELAGGAREGEGVLLASAVLDDGRAWQKFQRICEAQGGMRAPPVAAHRRPVACSRSGRIAAIDNRRLAKLAKLAGAPDAKAAGLELHARLDQEVSAGQPLYTVHAETPGELNYAIAYTAANGEIFRIVEP